MRLPGSVLMVFGILLLVSMPASAASTQGKNEIDVYVGGFFGDDLTDTSISGQQPELDDDITFGIRYGYNFTDAWGIDLSLGFTPGTAIGIGSVSGGEIDMDLLIFDADAIWIYSQDAKAKGYLVVGVGFASADLDEPITGTVNGNTVRIDDDSGFTLNAGAGWTF